MKNRFTTLDIVYMVHELRQKLVGLRVDQVYDIDKKTYLIRLAKTGTKIVLLLESGTRFHTTRFEWPKNPAPSGFTMKLRKHLNNKRLEKLEQVGADRILHLQFGMDTAAYHLFLELYDRGNIILTDHSFTILNLVRPRIVGEERMAAHEKYALDKAKLAFAIGRPEIEDILKSNPKGSLRDNFLGKVEFGTPLFNYVLKLVGFTPQTKIAQLIDSDDNTRTTIEKLVTAFVKGTEILEKVEGSGGFIVLKPPQTTNEAQPSLGQEAQAQPVFYEEFHPFVIQDNFGEGVQTYDSFDEGVDEFFSKVESQRIDMKQLNQEKEALKKLEKVKLGHHTRLKELQEGQEIDKQRAELITINQTSVDLAITTIRKLVANQVPWKTIEDQLKEARGLGDPLASMISSLNLKQNRITVKLSNVYDEDIEPLSVDLDLNLSAYANASKYFDLKKASAKKEERTNESQAKAFKSAEKKTIASLKEAATIHNIKKARKVFWFEKFRWFVTSENYLVIGGRDAQQNELLVKKYLKPRDIYMHADAHGAPTLIIKNDNPSEDILPKSLNECGVFAVSCSGSWESKIIATSWWVWGDQVSKSAPTGEYLPTGSFMIRGKKNYLPAYQLVLGFGLLFRVSEDSIEAHKSERSRKLGPEDLQNSETQEIEQEMDEDNEEDSDHSDEEFPDTHINLDVVGDKVRTRLASSTGTVDDNEVNQEEFIVTSAVTTSITSSVQKMKNKQKKTMKAVKNQPKGAKGQQNPPPPEPVEEAEDSPTHKAKRGQHGRKKKLKEKYKFQDDEERELRMKLLREGVTATASNPELIDRAPKSEPSGNKDEGDDDNDNTPADSVLRSEEGCSKSTKGENEWNKKTFEPDDPTKTENDQEAEVEETKEGESELDLLKSLTGFPLDSDELLYAIPVVAPYPTLQNYKFRVKMIPGTTKRGKAAKTALESFLREKDATPREKDVIKAVKDQDFARNFPGKVKLSNVIRDKK